jgi:hypothetical protein
MFDFEALEAFDNDLEFETKTDSLNNFGPGISDWMVFGPLVEELTEEQKLNQTPTSEESESVPVSIQQANQPLTKNTKKLRPFEQYVVDVCSGKKQLGDKM